MTPIQISRPTKSARVAMPADTADFFATGEDAFFDVIRIMTDAGVPDGPVEGIDERGVRCWTVRSMHACARLYRPNAGDLAARELRRIGEREYASWGVS